MPRSRDILQRFRPAGTPGAASGTGVPADRLAEATAELEPVIALLAATQDEARSIHSEAVRDAEQRRQQATERAGALVASAHRQAAAERAEAALRVSRDVEAETAARLAEADRAAAVVRERCAERLPALLDRVLTATRAALAAEQGAAR